MNNGVPRTRALRAVGAALLVLPWAGCGDDGSSADVSLGGDLIEGRFDTTGVDTEPGPDTAEANPDCPATHPAMTPSGGGACPAALRGSTCSWPAPGCDDGAREPNRCTCTDSGWTCDKPFLNCLPITEGGQLSRGERPAPERRVALTCSDVGVTSPDATCAPKRFEDGTSTCTTNADCGTGSVCLDTHTFGAGSVCSCHTPQCSTDDDCGEGRACRCGIVTSAAICDGWSDMPCAHRCLPASCRTDADCSDGGICSPSPDVCGWPTVAYACHYPDRAECLTDAECLGDVCQYDAAEARWRCVEPPLCE